MKRAFLPSALALAFSLAGLGCAASATPGVLPETPPHPEDKNKPEDPRKVAERTRAEAQFQRALGEMARLDKGESWTEADCGAVAKGFLDAAVIEGHELTARAVFNAGVAHERCRQDEDAKKLFERALALSPGFHPANVHLILMRHRERGGKDLDKAVSELRKVAIVDAKYSNVEALVALAMLSLERGNESADTDGANDRARAVRYLQSALAVDDGYSPAMNGLALYYLGEARSSSGRKAARARMSSGHGGQAKGTQAMELAALVCSQALRKDPRDAVIHNTYGLIQVELGNLGKAAEAFGKARQIRPGFYEAEMNFAAVNLQFRGFEKADEAYRAVLKARPDDYDARVGLALALRGQIQDANADRLVTAAAQELEKARKIAPDRPEAYYNEAILTKEYKLSGEGAQRAQAVRRARELFQQFMQKAGSASEYSEEVKAARERLTEIDQIEDFLNKTPQGGS
jgi:tetratricopeptide (TPR) repeat protein